MAAYEDELKRQLGLLGYKTTQSRGRASGATRKFYSYHEGTDIGTPAGTPIRPNFQGVYLGTVQDQTGYGTREAIYNPQTDQTFYLSHLAQTAKMNPGDTFQPGTTVAYTGGIPGTPGAGNTTGPHLDIVSAPGKSLPQYSYANNLSNAVTGSWRINPQAILQQAQQKYGKNVIAVSNSLDKLKEATKGKNVKYVKVTI